MGLSTSSCSRHLCSLFRGLFVLGLVSLSKETSVKPNGPINVGATRKAAATIEAIPDNTELSSKGSQAGCDHYRNGYLGLAMCVNFYDDTADGKAYVQVVGSMTNEGQVDICNLTISIAGLDTATYKTPAWLPTYPKDKSFKAGTYFPFTAILPINADSLASYRYPTVDVRTGFFACDAALRALPEDQVVPAPGTSRSSIEADDDFPGSNSGNSNNFGSKIRWSGLRTSAGAQMDCLGTCLANLHKQGDDCAAAAYVLHSGCLQNCPDTVPQWMVDACTKASCAAEQCALKTSASGPRRGGVGGSFAYFYYLMLGLIVYVGLWSLRNEGSF